MSIWQQLRSLFVRQRPVEIVRQEKAHAEALAHAARALAKVPGMNRAAAEIRQLEQSARRHS